MSADSVFYATGNGFNPGLPYINLSIPQCEDTVNGYYNPPYRMVMVKFFDNTGNFTTSINSVEQDEYKIDVFPNPTGQFLTLNFTDNNNNQKQVTIYNLTGIELLKYSTNNNTTINVESLPAGLYLLKVLEEDKFRIIKFIKQ